MPLVIHPRIGRSLRRIATLTALTWLAGAAAAQAACPTPAMSQPFAQFGDTGSYFTAPGGTFEEAKTSWKLRSRSAIVAENEPWRVNGPTHTRSLRVTNGSATSPVFCVDRTMPTFRMFARQTVRGAGLIVRLTYKDRYGKKRVHTDEFGILADGSMPFWRPTAPMELATALPIPAGGSLDVQIELETMKGASSWQVDDVEIDPYRS